MRTLAAAAVATALLSISARGFAQEAPVVLAPPPVQPTQRTLVHVENGSDLVIEQQMGWEWVIVCDGSCDRPLDILGTYRINGDDIRKSKPFHLEPQSGQPITLSVSRASTSLFALGITGVALGGSGIVIGLVTLFTEAIAEQCSNCAAGYANTTGLNIAWSVIGGSVVAVVAGVLLLANNRHTTVLSKAGDVEIPLRAVVKKPEPDFARIEAPPVLGLPILSGTF